LRRSASDGCSEEIQVGGSHVLIEDEVDVIRMGFEDVVTQLGSAVCMIKMVMGLLRVKDLVVRGGGGSRGRHEND